MSCTSKSTSASFQLTPQNCYIWSVHYANLSHRDICEMSTSLISRAPKFLTAIQWMDEYIKKRGKIYQLQIAFLCRRDGEQRNFTQRIIGGYQCIVGGFYSEE